MPFAAMWMELETIMLSEVRQRKTNTVCYHLYVESKILNKLMYTANRNRQIYKIYQLLQRKGRREEQDRVIRLRNRKQYDKIDKQQGYAVQHGELQSLFCNNFQQSIIYKNDHYAIYLKLI